MKHLKLILQALIFLCTHILYAQSKITISGYIEDQENSEKLIGATVIDQGTKYGAQTNVYGFYSITLPKSESYTLSFNYLGYESKQIVVYPKRDTLINTTLSTKIVLKEVVISSEKSVRIEERTEMSRITIPISQIKNMPALFGEVDILKSLQLLPGVQKGSEGSAGIYVRGGGPDQNLILLDAVPVYNATHLFGFFSVFNADAISNVELIKGGFPARFGGRLSSVIDITMKDGNKQKFKVNGGIGIISSRLTIEGPILKNKSSFIVSARRTYIDLLARPLIKAQAQGNVFGYYFYDVNAKVNYTVTDKDRIYLSFYNGKDKAYGNTKESYFSDNSTYTNENSFGINWGNTIAAIRWNKIIGSKLFSNTTATYTKYNFNTQNKNSSVKKENNNVVNKEDYLQKYFSGVYDWAIRQNFDYMLNHNNLIRFGATYTYHTFEPGSQQYKIQDIQNTQDTTFGLKNIFASEASVYIEDEIRFTKKIKANIGLHQAFFSVEKRNYFSLQPRISVNYNFYPGWALKASYAQMVQFLHLLTNGSIGLPTDLWVPATKQIAPQISKQGAMGVAHTIADEYEFSIETYYKHMQNVIEYKEGTSSLFSSADWQKNITTGQGWSYGAEFFIQKKAGKNTGWIGYTLSWTNRQFDQKNFGVPYPYKYDRRHDIGITYSRKISSKYDFSCNWVFGTGSAFTLALQEYAAAPNINGVFNNNIFFSQGGFGTQSEAVTPYLSSLNNLRMAPYHRLDIGVNAHLINKWGTSTWNFSVYNAYNRANPYFYYMGYNNSGQRKLMQVTIFRFLPSITYNFSF
jgi:hypothetical protein